MNHIFLKEKESPQSLKSVKDIVVQITMHDDRMGKYCISQQLW